MDNGLHVSAHGLHAGHPASYVIDRPCGLGCVLLVRFHSPMEVFTAQGLMNAEPGNCILYSAKHPQWYRARESDWVNDWMHIEDDGDAVAILAARYGLPMDTLLAPCDTRFLPRTFEEITHEKQHAEPGGEEAVELLVRQLLLKLGRALRNPATQLTRAEAEHLPVLRNLRWRVHEELSRRWTVREMATQAGLSASRFAALHQSFFGVSPLEDLLRARIQRAQYLLTNRSVSVSEAAAQCGFNSVDYFTHVFHQRVGCAPRDYHRRDSLWARE